MKSHISIAAILGAAGVIAVPDHAAIELNTFCVTYLSTYLVPVSQNASSTSDQFEPPFLTTVDGTIITLTDEPPRLTTVDGTTFTLTDEPDFTSNPTGEIASSALAPFISESSVQSGSETQTGTETDEPPLLTTIDLGTTTITAVVPTSSGIIEPQGQAVILAVNLDNDNQKRSIHKRTLGGFVGPNDPNVCTFASTFNFAEDQLFVSGLPVFYSPGDANKELVGGANPPGDAVTIGFTISGGSLGFNNANLPGGAASFCQTDDGRVFIVFTDGPPECTPVILLVYNVIRCQNGRIVGLESTTSSDTATSQAVSTDSATVIGSTRSALSSSSDFQSQSVAPVSQTTDSKVFTAASSDVDESTASLESTTADAPVSEASTTGTLAETETTDAPSTEAVDSTLVETSTESVEPDTTTAVASDSTSQPTLDSSQLPETVASTDVTTSDALESTTEPATDTKTTTADDTTTEDATTVDTTTADETETTTAAEATTTEETTTEPATTDTTTGDTTTAAEETTTATEETTTATEETTTAAEDTTTATEDTTTAVSETTTEGSFPEDTTTTTAPPIIPETTTTDGFLQETTTTPGP